MPLLMAGDVIALLAVGDRGADEALTGPDREGLGKPAFDAAMHRLIKAGQVRTETYGRPSDPHSRLALA